MNHSPGVADAAAAVDQLEPATSQLDPVAAQLEAATDQLVDELCQRLTSLYGLVDTSLTEAGPCVEDIRARAAALSQALRGPRSAATAAAILRALWPPEPRGQVPPPWWQTPLGAVIATALRAEAHRPPVRLRPPE